MSFCHFVTANHCQCEHPFRCFSAWDVRCSQGVLLGDFRHTSIEKGCLPLVAFTSNQGLKYWTYCSSVPLCQAPERPQWTMWCILNKNDKMLLLSTCLNSKLVWPCKTSINLTEQIKVAFYHIYIYKYK